VPAGQELCWVRECAPVTGVCSSFYLGLDRSCISEECTANSDCDDGNACTSDFCSGAPGTRACSWVPVQCDDGDVCTRDFCVGPTLGCRAETIPVEYCDDGVECTHDFCSPGFGCSHTQLACDDGNGCTSDACNETLGHCTYVPIVCPVSNDNCTLNYCMPGGCDSRTVCLASVEEGNQLGAGYVVLISFGVLIGVSLAAVGGYVSWKIALSASLANGLAGHGGGGLGGGHGGGHHGGQAKDFAVD